MGTDSDRRRDQRVPVPKPAGDGDAPERRAESEEPKAALERAFIDEFLATRGYTLRSVDRLPLLERQALLRAAAASATLRLAEIEARARLLDEID